jgi:nucleotide-binding universal stress UspA family protein
MFKSILVPLDGSELAECSLQYVQEIAQGCNVPVVNLLSVIEQPQEFTFEAGSQTQIEEEVEENAQMLAQAMDKANNYLTKASIKLSKENINVKTDVVQAPKNTGVAETIAEYAEKSAADLIVMSTHGRSGISRWAMGSVADKVIRSSTIPVLITVPHDCKK